MFTKKFNSLSDSLIEASKKIMTEASNEEPTINHLELSEEELNELSPAAVQKYREASRERMRNPSVVGKDLQKRQTGYSTATKKLSGDARVRVKEPEKKDDKSFGVKIGNVKPKATTSTPYPKSYSMIKEPPMRKEETSGKHGDNYEIAQWNKEEVNEALSPEAKKRRDELKAKVRAAKDAHKEISKQAKSPKSGLAPLKTSVTPKEHESEDPEESARKHPIDRLRRIALSTGGGHFEYDNGEKHKLSRDVARTIVKHYEVPSERGGLKPYQKEKLQSDITKSHDHMMKHYNSISGTNEAAFEPKKNGREMIIEKKPKKLDEVPVETVKQIKMFHQSEETELDEGQIRFRKFRSPEEAKKGLSGVVSGRISSTKIGEPSKSQKMDAKPSIERKPLEDRLGEETINEREMSKAEMNKREKIVMRLKDKMAGFKKRYGERAKDVMYATATKMAMKEETPKGKTMTGQKANPVEINPSAPTKEGIGIKSTTT